MPDMLTSCSEKSYNILTKTKGAAVLAELETKENEINGKAETKRTSRRRRSRRRKQRRRVSGVKLITLTVSVIVMLAFCVIMISPLRGCVMQDVNIGTSTAQKAAFSDAGVSADTAKNTETDLIKLDDGMCYKVDFTANDIDYSYIISADTGKIVISRSQPHPSDK